MAINIVDSTFNNFLNDGFAPSGFSRSFLEFPRELPGVLVLFISAALSFFCTRRLSAISMLLCSAGSLLIGFASLNYGTMVVWLFLYSVGNHLYMPLASTIGMELAKEGQDGRRLGQLNAIRNAAAVLGSFMVLLGFRYLGFTFRTTFAISAGLFLAAAILLFRMKPDKIAERDDYLRLHREYGLFYLLNAISGARKQIFVTFAPWVLVQILRQPTQVMASLFTVGGLVGILFQPLLGWAVDKFGERFVLAAEALILVFVCFGYGFATFLFEKETAFLVVCACFLLDQMIFSVGMARATYLKKIARRPEDIHPALSAALSIDHVFSIAAALLGGLVWNVFGFQYVFLLGALLAAINFLTALRVDIRRADGRSI